ncbi:hypothetical protein COCMIDRAFT_38525 [Bipolaris oryzae ATCC 44560]|uniref:Uncharacterized protein n=1 Tax=Bipolaris oryzae ATCC 44560 TaxID=930090 RepID=W6Z7H6_COCMI|nr:uncharacterized protein COCMIDRAFT_38525 [Bipolaris oryzae ATCC 44560]EUC43524.1 hypothetical protein COCMIDRAFT_38525 [Bipolaris oryzae ATCC 44560]
MRAARYYGVKDVRIEEISIPNRPADHVLLRVAWCGICGTDLTNYHTFGQAVMVDPRLYCSECSMCKQGDTNLCNKMGFVGLNGGGGGGFSELVAVDPKRCYRIADSSLDTACLIEPLAVARHALRVSGFSQFADKSSLILGAGPIGLAVVHNLKAVETEVNLVDTIEQLTNGKGVDVVFDCAGFIPAIAPAMSSLRKKDRYVLVADSGKPTILPQKEWYNREITVVASVTYNDVDFQEVVNDFDQGEFNGVEGMVSSRIQLDQFVSQGLEALVTSKDTLLKVLVEPK